MERFPFFAECEAMIRRGSTTFYSAFASLPSPRKEAVHVIYAFCRMIDDAVDEPDTSPYTLDELEHEFAGLDRAAGHFIWPALRWLFASFPVSKEPFFKQMEGQRRDYSLTRYETMEQLEEYCYLVAGTVGEMLLPVLHDAPDERTIRAGIALGKAMQIVNIVRDVGEDWARGRRYVPLELLLAAGYSEDRFARGVTDTGWRNVVGRLDAMARDGFADGLRDLAGYPKRSAFCIELAARYYEAILDEVQDNGCDSFRKRAVVGAHRKASLLLPLVRRYGFTGGQEAVS